MRPFLLVLFSVFGHGQAEIKNYIDAFADMHSSDTPFVWPLPNSSGDGSIGYGGDFLSSAFGPRIKISTQSYDFHRGVDIHGEVGDPVVAPYAATVEKIVTYNDGGLTVILRHEFPQNFQVKLKDSAKETSIFYTLHMHLDANLVIQGNVVEAGQLIGNVGMSGSAVSPHLHLEVRIGTRCSLEYAVDNPTSSCNTFNYDPHINPLLILPQSETGPSDVSAEYLSDPGDRTKKIVHVTTPDSNPSVNAYLISIVNSRGRVKKFYELDLNERIGFDATSTKALDTQDTSYPYLDPISFGYTKSEWSTNLVIPQTWFGSKRSSHAVTVDIVDIWGATTTITFGSGERW